MILSPGSCLVSMRPSGRQWGDGSPSRKPSRAGTGHGERANDKGEGVEVGPVLLRGLCHPRSAADYLRLHHHLCLHGVGDEAVLLGVSYGLVGIGLAGIG